MVTLYQTFGSRHGDDMAYPTAEAAEAFARDHPTYYPHGWTLEAIAYQLPHDAIWEGEQVELDLHVEGRWYEAVPGIAHVLVVNIRRGEVYGQILNQYGEVLQAVLLHEGAGGFPYRHLRRRGGHTASQDDSVTTN